MKRSGLHTLAFRFSPACPLVDVRRESRYA
jgi:hypothetical protein